MILHVFSHVFLKGRTFSSVLKKVVKKCPKIVRNRPENETKSKKTAPQKHMKKTVGHVWKNDPKMGPMLAPKRQKRSKKAPAEGWRMTGSALSGAGHCFRESGSVI